MTGEPQLGKRIGKMQTEPRERGRQKFTTEKSPEPNSEKQAGPEKRRRETEIGITGKVGQAEC